MPDCKLWETEPGAGDSMMRRYSGEMAGERFLGDRRTMQVHDLELEETAPQGCRIDEIIRGGHDVPFAYIGAAHNAGYDNCRHCIGKAVV